MVFKKYTIWKKRSQIFCLGVLLCLIGVKTSLGAADQVPVFNLPSQAHTLPNGLRVFLVKYPSPGVVAYQLPVRVGSRNEIETGKTGFAHFFEHLMFRGTKKRSAKDFDRFYARLGCEHNAWTWMDMTNYHGVVASVYLPQILEAEADRFMNLSFDEKGLKDEAGAVLGEYNKDVAQPEFQMEEKLLATAFTQHPYGHSTMGYKEDVLKFTERYKDVWPFFKRYYRPENVSVILVGDVDFVRDLKEVEKVFGGWKTPTVPAVTIPVEPEQKAPRQAEVKLAKPTQTRVTISFKVPAFSTKSVESASMSLIAEMLFSVTSPFQKEYRFKRKWLDSLDAGYIESIDPGLWNISLRLASEGEGREQELMRAVEGTLQELRAAVPATERLEATKRRFRNGAITNWFTSPESLAGRIAWYTVFEPDLGVINRVFETLDRVSVQDLTDFARKYLIESRRNTIILRGAK